MTRGCERMSVSISVAILFLLFCGTLSVTFPIFAAIQSSSCALKEHHILYMIFFIIIVRFTRGEKRPLQSEEDSSLISFFLLRDSLGLENRFLFSSFLP